MLVKCTMRRKAERKLHTGEKMRLRGREGTAWVGILEKFHFKLEQRFSMGYTHSTFNKKKDIEGRGVAALTLWPWAGWKSKSGLYHGVAALYSPHIKRIGRNPETVKIMRWIYEGEKFSPEGGPQHISTLRDSCCNFYTGIAFYQHICTRLIIHPKSGWCWWYITAICFAFSAKF